jgi:uncharacterized protein with HEPN domain
VNDHQALIWKKLDHLARMRDYLRYSVEQIQALQMPLVWEQLTPDEHESLAAFRVRFSEFQEHMGKTMKAVAVEEEKPSEPFTAVLLYMEKLGCLESVDRWKEIRELRNAVNHEYEDDSVALQGLFQAMLSSTPELLRWHDRLLAFCAQTYPR